MNLAKKAALFNALFFPGWGQIYLKHYKKGVLIILSVLAGILSIVWSLIQQAKAFLKISPFAKGTVTFGGIVELAVNSLRSLEISYLLLISLFLILLWIFSIIDAYASGKKEMAKSNTPSDQQSVSPPV